MGALSHDAGHFACAVITIAVVGLGLLLARFRN
jgi:hypothetical protein